MVVHLQPGIKMRAHVRDNLKTQSGNGLERREARHPSLFGSGSADCPPVLALEEARARMRKAPGLTEQKARRCVRGAASCARRPANQKLERNPKNASVESHCRIVVAVRIAPRSVIPRAVALDSLTRCGERHSTVAAGLRALVFNPSPWVFK